MCRGPLLPPLDFGWCDGIFTWISEICDNAGLLANAICTEADPNDTPSMPPTNIVQVFVLCLSSRELTSLPSESHALISRRIGYSVGRKFGRTHFLFVRPRWDLRTERLDQCKINTI